MIKRRLSNKWWIALAACLVVLCVSVFVGALGAFAVGETALTVSLTQTEGIPDDHNSSTIKNILTVNVVDRDDETVITEKNISDYTVTINGAADGKLLVGQTNTLEISRSGSDSATLTIEGSQVVKATPTLSLVPNSSYVLQDDGYYHQADGFFAFTQGMDQNDLKARLSTVLVQYPNHSVSVSIDDAQVTFVNGTGSNSDEAHEALINVSLEVDGETISQQCSVKLRKVEPYALVIIDGTWSKPTSGLTSSTDISSSANLASALNFTDSTIGVVDTAGNVDTHYSIFTNMLTTQDALTPTASYLADLAANKAAPTYLTTISVRLTDEALSQLGVDSLQPLVISDLEVTYSAPTRIRDIGYNSFNASVQYARTDFNYADFYIEFMFGTARRQAPASDYAQYITPRYYTDEAAEHPCADPTTITTSAKYVQFSYNIPVGNGKYLQDTHDVTFQIQVEQTAVPLPELDNFEPSFEKDNSVTLSNFATLDGDNPVIVKVGGTTYTPDSDGNYVITFDKGGTFYIEVILSKGADGDYAWTMSSAQGTITNDGQWTLRYTVNVKKAPIKLSFNYDETIQYGDSENPVISGSVIGNDSMPYVLGTRVYGDFTQAADSVENPQYRLVYEGKKYDGTDIGKVYTMPTERGNYTVYLETAETAYYQAGTTEQNKLSFEITKREISVGSIAASATFNKTEFDASSFFTASGGTFAYTDTAADVLSLTFTSASGNNNSRIFHADTYTITLAITNNNYVFDDSTTSVSKKFEVKPATLNISFMQSGFTYGQSVTVPTATVDHSDWVKLLAPVYKVKNGATVNANNSDTWNIGTYEVTFAIDKVNFNDTDVLASDITCADVTQEFEVNPARISKITLTGSGWGTDLNSIGSLGIYGNSFIYTLNNWSANVMDGDTSLLVQDLVTLTVEGKRFAPNAGTAIANLSNADILSGSDITITEAGTYTVTLKLPANYVWNEDGTNDDLVYYGKIDKRQLSNLLIDGYDPDEELEYNGEIRGSNGNGAQVLFKREGLDANAVWMSDIITIKSVTGANYAAAYYGTKTANEDGSDNDYILQSVGQFNIKDAGEYTIVVGISNIDNYEWLDGTDTSVDDKELVVVINRTVLVVDEWMSGYWPFVADEEIGLPEYWLQLQGSDSENDWIIYRTIYDADNVIHNNIDATKAIFPHAGEYTIRITGIGGKDGDISYLNYYVPTEGEGLANVTYKFTISSIELDEMSFALTIRNRDDKDAREAQITNGLGTFSNYTISTRYGTVTDFISEFVMVYGTDEYQFVDISQTGCLEMTIDGKVHDGSVLPVKRDAQGNIISYTILIKPAKNYKWDTFDEDVEQLPITCIVTITPLPVDIDWSGVMDDVANNTYVYTGLPQVIDDGSYAIANKKRVTDEIYLDFEFTQGLQGSTVGARVDCINAGRYDVIAAALRGADSYNYTLTGGTNLRLCDYVGNTSIDSFVVVKQAINKPTQPNTLTGQFNGNEQTANIGGWNALPATVKATLARYAPAEWFNDGTSANENIAGISLGHGFDVATGTFTYTHAGWYTVKFTIEDSANYYWADETDQIDNFDVESGSYQYSWHDNGDDFFFAKIDRETITAPALGNLRAIEQNDENFISFKDSIFAAGTTVHGIAYTPIYYTRDGSTSNTDEFKVDRVGGEASGKLVRGQYYILLDFSPNTGRHDFVWQVLPDGEDGEFLGSSSLEGGLVYEIIYTRNGGAQVKLYYAITASQVEIEFTVGTYMFGDNGQGGWANDVTKIFTRTVADSHAEGSILDTEYKFYKIVDGVVSESEYTDIVRGLPWDAGKYRVNITITFRQEGGNDVYQTWHSSGLELEVSPRPIAVKWSTSSILELGEWTTAGIYEADYKATSPLVYLQANITNMPKRNAADSTAAPQLTIASYVGNNAVSAINAGDYKVKVTSITGEGASNFTITDGTNTETNLKINRATFTVKINPVTGHVYGDKISEVTAAGAYSKTEGIGEFYGNDANNVYLRVMKGGVDYTTNSRTPVGTYDLVLAWKEGETFIYAASNVLQTTNYEITISNANNAKFTVVEREITVTLNGGSSSVYGNAVNLYGLYTATTSNGDGSALVDTDNTVFSLTVTRADGKSIAYPNDSTKWNVGSYLVTGARTNTNYSITFVNNGTCTYEITNAAIDESSVTIASNHASGSYTGAAFALFTGFSAATVNSDLNPAKLYFKNVDATSDFCPDWTEYDSSVHKLKDVCNYEFYIMVKADNHDDLQITATIKFVITPVTLTITPSLTIYYGEKSPVGYNGAGTVYGATLADLKGETGVNIKYAITGFVNPDDIGTIGLGGSFSYTTNYAQGNAVGTYAITLDVTQLTSTNYVFTSNEGDLDVKPLALTVNIADVSTVYLTAYSAGMFSTTVTLPNGTYTGAELTENDLDAGVWTAVKTGTNYTADSVIELTTNAYDNGNTKAVVTPSPYRISGAVKAAMTSSYTATFTGSDTDKGIHTITNATLEVADITGYTGEYDEASHLALIVKKDGAVTTVFATTRDGSAVQVLFFVSANALTEAQVTAIDWDNANNILNANPSYIDVVDCYVYFRIKADNHDTLYDGKHVEITVAANALTTQFKFADANGWTYGLYSANNTDGYDKNGKHAITEPAAKFTRKDNVNGGNKLVVKLYVGLDEDKVQLYSDETFNDVASLFAKAWSDGAFNAGTYCLNVSMESTSNYGALSEDFIFVVDKHTLTVTAQNLNVTYGDDAPEYVYTVTGYVDNGKGVETAADVMSNGRKVDEFNYFTSSYQAGRVNGSVGTYSIYHFANGVVAAGLDSPEFDNYELTFDETKTLTVGKRLVTITIEDKENTYNLQGGETAQTLTFKVADGSLNFLKSDILDDVTAELPAIYDNGNQKIIELLTDALTNSNASIATNNVIMNGYGVDGYPIYAQYRNDLDGSSWSGNYDIAFENCSSHSDNGIGSGNNAGKFVIKQATLTLLPVGVFYKDDDNQERANTTLQYTGADNYYKVQVEGDNTVTVEFTYTKYNSADNKYEATANVINVGTYTASAKLNTDNYVATQSTFTFVISSATMTITAKETSIQYGSPLNDQSVTDGRFGGFDYEVASDTILKSVMDAYVLANKVTYTSDNYQTNTPAGADYCKIIPVCASTDNVNVVVNGAKLNVIKRNVTVTIAGYTNGNEDKAWTYYKGTNPATQQALNELLASNISNFVVLSATEKGGAFGSSGDDRTALGISLTLPSTAFAANSNGYAMTATSDSANYNVEFTNFDSAVFVVKKALLTIYANTLGVGNAVNSYSVVYGNSAPTYAFAVDGMQADENFESLLAAARGKNITNDDFTAVCGNKSFEAWNSNVVETYTVAINNFGDILDNYDLANSTYVTASMAITPRPVIVTTPSEMDYEEATDGNGKPIYNNGVSGKQHDAILTFSDNSVIVPEEVKQNIDVNYRPVYTLAYKYKTNGTLIDGTNPSKAPTKAGSYSVTVTLEANGNYEFVLSEGDNNKVNTLDFVVNKKKVVEGQFSWYKVLISLEEGATSYSNMLEGIDNEALLASDGIFDGIIFSYTSGSGEGSSSILLGNAGEIDRYYADADGHLCVTLLQRGRYTLQFKLKDSATDNYEIVSDHDTYIHVSFSVTSTSIDITLTIDGWRYDEEAKAPDVKVDGSTPTTGVTITYARVTEGDIAAFIANNPNMIATGFDKTVIDDNSWQVGSFLSSITFNVGYYVVRAVYTGMYEDDGITMPITTDIYNVFQITPGIINVPTFETVKDYVFDGQEQSAKVVYDSVLLSASYDGHTGIANNGIVIYGTAAGNYRVEFRIANTANYVWADDADAIDGVVTLVWTIGRDEADNDETTEYISISDVVSTFGSAYVVGTPTIKAGYIGVVTISYAVRADGEIEPSATAEWKSDMPVNADTYWIKAVLSDGGNNFTDKIAYAKLTINKLRITATASGTITYGDSFDNTSNKLTYVVSGLLGNDVATDNGVSYKLVADYTAGGNKMIVGGTYYVILENTDGIVNNLDAGSNYEIEAVQGALTITARQVTVSIGNASSEYKKTVSVNGVSVDIDDDYAREDSEFVVVLSTVATNGSPVDTYPITGTVINSNYDVRFESGIYTISQRKVYVTLTTVISNVFGSNITPVTIVSVLDSEAADMTSGALASDAETVTIDGFVITITYSGDANDKLAYTGMPTHAGSYLATVTATGNDNYVLENVPHVQFVINKQTVNEDAIVIANQTYQSIALAPEIEDTDIYSVGNEKFTNAGTHNVKLTLNDFNNYKWTNVDGAVAYRPFVIDKATLYVTPNGTLTYGEAFADGSFGYTVSGYEVNDNASNVRISANNLVQYLLTNDADNANKDRLTVGSYEITMAVADGYVVGLTTDNYNIVLESGYGKTLTVNKRDITITVSSETSVFNKADVTLTNSFTVTKGSLASWDNESVLKVTYKLKDVTSAQNYGEYVVTVDSYDDSNYNVEVIDGKHTIEQLKVGIKVTVTDGWYLGSDAKVVISDITATNLDGYEIVEKLTFNINYSGFTNGQTPINGTTVPTLAGSYLATVTGIDESNYVLDTTWSDGNVSAPFVVNKKDVDSSLLIIDSKPYAGKPLTPDIKVGAEHNEMFYYDNNGTQELVFNVLSHEDFVNAGNHTVTLALVDSNNYRWAKSDESTKDVIFVIDKATLYVTPNGTLTYGQEFNEGIFNYSVSGYVGFDDQFTVQINANSLVEYLFSVTNGDDVNKNRLTVGSYEITMAVADGYVVGLTSDNYNLVLASGYGKTFEVGQRAITIQVASATAKYSDNIIVPQDFEIVSGTLAKWDTKAKLNYVAYLDDELSGDMGVASYDILAEIDNDNYDAKILVGKYTIDQIVIGIIISANNGRYEEQDASLSIFRIWAVGNDKLDLSEITINDFTIRYTGRTNNGVAYDSEEMPTLAGEYLATVTKLNGFNNYAFNSSLGTTSVVVKILQQEIDSRHISVVTKTYTGKALTADIIDNYYNVDGKVLYTMNEHEDFVNAGTHNVGLTLVDPYNYKWLRIETADTTIPFVVKKAQNYITSGAGSTQEGVITIGNWTYGDGASNPIASVLFGESANIIFEYSTEENGLYAVNVPSKAGTYWVRATMPATDNYEAFTSGSVMFTIFKCIVTAPNLTFSSEGATKNDTYTGRTLSSAIMNFDGALMRLNYDGIANVNGNNVTVSALDAGDHHVVLTLIDPSNYVWAENTELDSEGNVDLLWHIERQKVAKPTANNNTYIVNGNDIVYIPNGFDSSIMNIEGNVRGYGGDSIVTVTLRDTDNYVWEDGTTTEVEFTFSIIGINVVVIIVIAVISGACVGLAVMALIQALRHRAKKRAEAAAIDERSRADGWTGEDDEDYD